MRVSQEKLVNVPRKLQACTMPRTEYTSAEKG